MAGPKRTVNIGANALSYSGRGRPRKEVGITETTTSTTTTAAAVRSLPVGIVLGSPSSPAMTDLYKNRKIRVGGLFQAKVPKYIAPSSNDSSNNNDADGIDGSNNNKYASARPPPSRVSWDHPHLTDEQVQVHKRKMMEETEQRREESIDQLAAEGGSTAMDVDVALIPQTATTPTPTPTTTLSSPHNNNNDNNINNNNISKTSLTSNYSGSLKTSTINRQNDEGGDDDDNDDDDDEEMEQCFATERGGLLLCPADPSPTTTTTSIQPNLLTTSTSKTITRRLSAASQPAADKTHSNNKGPSAEDDFWSFAQPLLLATNIAATGSAGDPSLLTTKNWQSQILQWNLDKQHQQQQAVQKVEEEIAQQPKRRGRRKRKPDLPAGPLQEENSIEWYTNHIMGLGSNNNNNNNNDKKEKENNHHNSKRQRSCSMVTNSSNNSHVDVDDDYLRGTHEERLQALQHLWLRHKGQSAAAKLETIVQLSAGKAEFARRVRQHKRRKQRKPDANHRCSWRLKCEESFVTSMTGDFRNPNSTTSMKYAFPATMDTTNSNNMDGRFNGHEEETDVEVQKEIWKSILAFGRSIEETLLKATSNGSGNTTTTNNNNAVLPKLSMLLSFLNNAYQVRPIPEDIFRAPSVPPEINTCLNNIMECVDKARKRQAEFIDLLHESHYGGVDLDSLQKILDQPGRSLSVELDDAQEFHRQVGLFVDWQARLDIVVDENDLRLSSLEDLATEGHSFAFRTKSLVQLESRIHRAYLLRDRIEDWRKSCTQDEEDLADKKESVKFLGAMVRDANKLKLDFPEVSELLETHRSVEAWIDRASIAIRSRISLSEIKALLATGEEMPVDLSDSMEKLRARVSMAEEWIEQFQEVVPCPEPLSTADTVDSDNTSLRWMFHMRDSLVEGKHSTLHDLASEGNRIPVDVDIVKLLQIELDAKNWTMKARKWIPCLATKEEDAASCKRGKLEDLREHLEKASTLREKLALPTVVRNEWSLEGEKEMRAIVQAADDWFENHKLYLDWDNRRSEGRSCLSLEKLTTIVEEAAAIHANIGSASGKMTRILTQAEGWVKAHESLLVRCNIIKREADSSQSFYVTLPQMKAAAEAASSSVSLDLDEAKELEKMVVLVKDWSDRVLNAAPKRSKRQGRGRKARVTVDDIIELIKEASNIPVDTSGDVHRLQIQLSEVQEWRAQARQELEVILNGFQKLRLVVDDMYGPPSEYSRDNDDNAEGSDEEDDGGGNTKNGNASSEEKKVTEDVTMGETNSTTGSEAAEDISQIGSGKCNVNQLIKNYHREAKSFGVISGEVEVADQLEKISTWCVRSLKYLSTQRDVFDKRYFGAFDRFVIEGQELVAASKGEGKKEQASLDDAAFAEKLRSTWGSFVSDQLKRLKILVVDRERFMAWCDSAEASLFKFKVDKRPPLEVLKDVADQSRNFPSVCDMVQKVRGLYNKTMEWKASTRKLLHEGSEKLNLYEAKTVLDEGEKLGFLCDELKDLRNAHHAARDWGNRAKQCDIEQGATNANEVQDLIDEHDELLLELPEEMARLEEAMKGYCICRRAYSGFMIGCDECEEWYHGSCIGVSESRADRFDKYACVRCCVTRAFKSTAKEAVGVVRKWTCQKDMKKARQVEAQKHQRKVRKETKDIEKLQIEIKRLEESLLQPAPESESTAVDKSALDGVMTDAGNTAPIGVVEPLETPNETPMKTPIETPVDTSVGASTDTLADTPAEIPVEIPVESSADTPAENLVEAPAEIPADTAVEAPVEAPVEALADTPVETPAETSAEAPVEAPAELPLAAENSAPAGASESKPLEAPENEKEEPKISPEGVKKKIVKAHSKIDACTKRLSVLTKKGEERKSILMQEDANATMLRLWCLRARSLVLAPRSDEGVEQSRPLMDGSLSFAMKKAIDEARTLNILDLADVDTVVNSFKCMSWCILATYYLGRKPSFAEVDLLMTRAKTINLPEEKALRMIKGMHSRAKSWQTKVMKELVPIPGEKKSYNVIALKELEEACEEIPMRMKEGALVTGVIEDKGVRHCLCGGPSDARFMLSCDNCEKWFHGPCVNMTKPKCEGVEKWICPPCSGSPLSELGNSASVIVLTELKTRSRPNVSPEAPDASKMWPPFGLFSSASALEILGEKCSAIPDVAETYMETKQSQPSAEPQSQPQPAETVEAVSTTTTNVQLVLPATNDAPDKSSADELALILVDQTPKLNGASQMLPSIAEAATTNGEHKECTQAVNLSVLDAVALAATVEQMDDPSTLQSLAAEAVANAAASMDKASVVIVAEACNQEGSSSVKATSSTAAQVDSVPMAKMEAEQHSNQESNVNATAPRMESNTDNLEKTSPEPVMEPQNDATPVAGMAVTMEIEAVPHSDTVIKFQNGAMPVADMDVAMQVEHSSLEVNPKAASPSDAVIEFQNDAIPVTDMDVAMEAEYSSQEVVPEVAPEATSHPDVVPVADMDVAMEAEHSHHEIDLKAASPSDVVIESQNDADTEVAIEDEHSSHKIDQKAASIPNAEVEIRNQEDNHGVQPASKSQVNPATAFAANIEHSKHEEMSLSAVVTNQSQQEGSGNAAAPLSEAMIADMEIQDNIQKSEETIASPPAVNIEKKQESTTFESENEPEKSRSIPVETAGNLEASAMEIEKIVSGAKSVVVDANSHNLQTTLNATTTASQVPAVAESAANKQAPQTTKSDTTLSDAVNVSLHSSPTLAPSLAPTNESPDENMPAAETDDIELSPQLNPATMNVMVPALPVQDSGS